jgi:hypothetical protein
MKIWANRRRFLGLNALRLAPVRGHVATEVDTTAMCDFFATGYSNSAVIVRPTTAQRLLGCDRVSRGSLSEASRDFDLELLHALCRGFAYHQAGVGVL